VIGVLRVRFGLWLRAGDMGTGDRVVRRVLPVVFSLLCRPLACFVIAGFFAGVVGWLVILVLS